MGFWTTVIAIGLGIFGADILALGLRYALSWLTFRALKRKQDQYFEQLGRTVQLGPGNGGAGSDGSDFLDFDPPTSVN